MHACVLVIPYKTSPSCPLSYYNQLFFHQSFIATAIAVNHCNSMPGSSTLTRERVILFISPVYFFLLAHNRSLLLPLIIFSTTNPLDSLLPLIIFPISTFLTPNASYLPLFLHSLGLGVGACLTSLSPSGMFRGLGANSDPGIISRKISLKNVIEYLLYYTIFFCLLYPINCVDFLPIS